ncbi:MAG: phosphatase PAP2 family protein, partial [Ilyomonas sp.]
IPDELRPYKAIADRALIHTVSFVEPYTTSSFPSGHTGTAFSFYLLFCLIFHKKWWIWAGFTGALLVGYSRVYLAQHFPLDVAGGIIVAIVTASISVQVQKIWMKRKIVNRKPSTDDR